MKKCTSCGIEKQLTDFNKNPQSKDGLGCWCKECAKIKRRERAIRQIKNPEWLKHSREMRRLRYYRNKDMELSRKHKYIKSFPERKLANNIAGYNVKDMPGFEKHHWSYNEDHWLDIIYLTKQHHRFAHKYIIYDQERMMYRGLDGVLLDTKEDHESYIDMILTKYGYR